MGLGGASASATARGRQEIAGGSLVRYFHPGDPHPRTPRGLFSATGRDQPHLHKRAGAQAGWPKPASAHAGRPRAVHRRAVSAFFTPLSGLFTPIRHCCNLKRPQSIAVSICYIHPDRPTSATKPAHPNHPGQSARPIAQCATFRRPSSGPAQPPPG